MKALWSVIAVMFALVGLTAYVIFERSHAQARAAVQLLRPYGATIEKVERCRGRSTCYETLVSYVADGEARRSRVLGDLGKAGSSTTVWAMPAYSRAYVSPESYLNLSTRTWFLPFFVPGLMVFGLVIAMLSQAAERRAAAKAERPGA